MDQGKKGSKSLQCHVCKIDFNSNADYALHEFSKKHCDNLIRLAKQKPIVSKQKAKIQPPKVEKEPPKINSVTHTGSFAKYGYFVPGEVYANAETSKEYNTDYDPYLQKFAENPFKEKPAPPAVGEQPTFSSITSFSKKKKKKIKTCNVCNVTLLSVPEYEAHLKSLQHIWNLKVTGMGVTAHFVKATSDLHTTDVNEEPKPSSETDEQIPVCTAPVTTTTTSADGSSSGPFPLLYCSDCEMLLNSLQQYNTHIVGKMHIKCAQRKAELKAKKEKLENPSPDQLYCYSCKISLNNLFQYNEHKNGKKHKTKCVNLVRKGITIPPEERVPGISLPNPNRPVVYPELYEKLILEKQKERESKSEHAQLDLQINSSCGETNAGPTYGLNYYPSSITQYNSRHISDQKLNSSEATAEESTTQVTDSGSESPKIIFHKNQASLAANQNCDNPVPDVNSLQGDIQHQKDCPPDSLNAKSNESGVSRKQITILSDSTPVKCSICNESFQWQHLLDAHLGTEDHLMNILKQKSNGRSETDILNTLFSDRNVIKPNNFGKLTCSICNVTMDNSIEFDQHLNSIFHKYTLKDYKVKRTLEVKNIVGSNEENVYFCKLCREGWPSLLEYTQHLHFVKHKSMQRAQRAKTVLAKRRSLYIQKPKLGLKKRSVALRRAKPGKSSGVRTKVCGAAVNLNSGTQAPVSNQEPSEHKIDETKNINIGTPEKLSDKTTSDEVKESTVKKSEQVARPNRKSFANRRGSPYHGKRPPLMSIPPLMSSIPFQPHFPRPSFAPARNWAPFSSPHPSMLRPYCEGPAMGNPYYAPSWNQRPPWSRFR